MKTRRGASYSFHAAAAQAPGDGPEAVHHRKRRRTATEGSLATAVSAPGVRLTTRDMFEEPPDDLVVSILRDVAASVGSPANLGGTLLMWCSRGRRRDASPCAPRLWSDDAHWFMQRCVDAGNLEGYNFLGMIRFYCLAGSRGSGATLMAAAAVGRDREALYSLAVFQFNGSGGVKDDNDLRAGGALCACLASLGHVDALRELGHCLQDGYGVRRSVLDGRRLLIQANARELQAVVTACVAGADGGNGKAVPRRHSCLLSDFGCRAAVAGGEGHAANRFLVEWFASRPLCPTAAAAITPAGNRNPGTTAASPAEEDAVGALRLCSQPMCGRPETPRHKFRRCSVCGMVNYCSRACQALHGRWHTRRSACPRTGGSTSPWEWSAAQPNAMPMLVGAIN